MCREVKEDIKYEVKKYKSVKFLKELLCFISLREVKVRQFFLVKSAFETNILGKNRGEYTIGTSLASRTFW